MWLSPCSTSGTSETYNARKGASARKMMLWPLLGQSTSPPWWPSFLRGRGFHSSQRLDIIEEPQSLTPQRNMGFDWASLHLHEGQKGKQIVRRPETQGWAVRTTHLPENLPSGNSLVLYIQEVSTGKSQLLSSQTRSQALKQAKWIICTMLVSCSATLRKLLKEKQWAVL